MHDILEILQNQQRTHALGPILIVGPVELGNLRHIYSVRIRHVLNEEGIENSELLLAKLKLKRRKMLPGPSRHSSCS